jgi:hypothetical protein
MSTLEIPVVFRKFSNGAIIALFPTFDDGNYRVASYMHVGQHGGADYDVVVSSTKIASESEYRELFQELQSIGYENLKVYRRFRPTYG